MEERKFNTFPQKWGILATTGSNAAFIDKLVKYELAIRTVMWAENWLGQRVVISVTKAKWRPVTSAVPQASILGPTLLNISINDLGDKTKHPLSKFTDDTELGGASDKPESCAAIQRHLDRLENSAHRSLMKFSKQKCEICVKKKVCLYTPVQSPLIEQEATSTH